MLHLLPFTDWLHKSSTSSSSQSTKSDCKWSRTNNITPVLLNERRFLAHYHIRTWCFWFIPSGSKTEAWAWWTSRPYTPGSASNYTLEWTQSIAWTLTASSFRIPYERMKRLATSMLIYRFTRFTLASNINHHFFATGKEIVFGFAEFRKLRWSSSKSGNR